MAQQNLTIGTANAPTSFNPFLSEGRSSENANNLSLNLDVNKTNLGTPSAADGINDDVKNSFSARMGNRLGSPLTARLSARNMLPMEN